LNWLSAEKAQQRGGGRRMLPLGLEPDGAESWKEPAHSLTPEAVFEYHWTASLLDRTLRRVRASHLGREFDVMKPFLVGEADRGTLAAAAARLEMSEGAFKVAVHWLRKHRELLRAEILETLEDAGHVEDEIRYLLRVLVQSDGRAQ
jgi:RNA polymerase sigma-70 factor (ECF subfamily)